MLFPLVPDAHWNRHVICQSEHVTGIEDKRLGGALEGILYVELKAVFPVVIIDGRGVRRGGDGNDGVDNVQLSQVRHGQPPGANPRLRHRDKKGLDNLGSGRGGCPQAVEQPCEAGQRPKPPVKNSTGEVSHRHPSIIDPFYC